MVRSILSIGLALAILVVVVTGSCLACQPGNAAARAKCADCCKHQRTCPKPIQKIHVDCGSPAIDPFTVEQASTPSGDALALVPLVLPADDSLAAKANQLPPVDGAGSFPPADLRLLNSSLTI